MTEPTDQFDNYTTSSGVPKNIFRHGDIWEG